MVSASYNLYKCVTVHKKVRFVHISTVSYTMRLFQNFQYLFFLKLTFLNANPAVGLGSSSCRDAFASSNYVNGDLKQEDAVLRTQRSTARLKFK